MKALHDERHRQTFVVRFFHELLGAVLTWCCKYSGCNAKIDVGVRSGQDGFDENQSHAGNRYSIPYYTSAFRFHQGRCSKFDTLSGPKAAHALLSIAMHVPWVSRYFDAVPCTCCDQGAPSPPT